MEMVNVVRKWNKSFLSIFFGSFTLIHRKKRDKESDCCNERGCQLSKTIVYFGNQWSCCFFKWMNDLLKLRTTMRE